MALTTQNLRDDFANGPMGQAGQIVIKYFTGSAAASDYDDASVSNLTQSGTSVWTSGLVLPLDERRGSSDALLLEQGRLLQDDLKLYVQSSVDTSGLLTIGLGSPATRTYAITPDNGVIDWKLNGDTIYQKMYLRYLTNGSLY